MTTIATLTPAQIITRLEAHHGSEQRFRHWTRRIVYTPGVRELAELCEAYWLIDLIASHQLDPSVRATDFQVWTLTVGANRTATATCEHDNGRVIARQDIEFTDFPLTTIRLFLIEDVLLLPGEY